MIGQSTRVGVVPKTDQVTRDLTPKQRNYLIENNLIEKLLTLISS